MSGERDWVDRVADLAASIGLNRVRVRWKLDRARQRWARLARRTEQQVDHLTYEHQTCPRCGAVQDRGARVCSRCDARLGGRALQLARRFGLSAPRLVSMSSLLGLACAVVFARLLAAGGGIASLWSLDSGLLYHFGGNFAPSVTAGEHWRLFTAIFLHVGLWHIAFNLSALAIVGPQVEDLYGRGTMLLLFMVTGVAGNLASHWWQTFGVAAGASGALMGLIGVVAGWGQRAGTTIGRNARNAMIKWCLYTVLFGFFIGADNAAHLGGFVAGALLGYAIRPERWRARRLAPLRAVGAVIGLVAAGLGIWLALSPPRSQRPLMGARDDEAGFVEPAPPASGDEP